MEHNKASFSFFKEYLHDIFEIILCSSEKVFIGPGRAMKYTFHLKMYLDGVITP
jgi:hypothetical protein